jgi:hypothetical protein
MSKTNVLSPDQRAALDRLVELGVLSPEQRSAVVTELESARAPAGISAGGGAWEVVAYIGGALVLGGASLLIGMSWDDLVRPARVGLLAAATLVLLGAGTVIGGGPGSLRALRDAASSPRIRICAVLFALASGTSAMAVGSALDVGESVAATAVGFVVALLGYCALPTAAGVLAAGAFSVGVVLAVVSEWFDSSTTPTTIGLLGLGVLWAAAGLARTLRHRDVAVIGGALIALAGAQVPVGSEQPAWAYAATLVVALACFQGYLVLEMPVLLLLGVLGVTLAVPEAIWDWTGGQLSGPLIVLIVGLVFLAAAGVGLRLRRKSREVADD